MQGLGTACEPAPRIPFALCPAGFLHHGFHLSFDHPKFLIKNKKEGEDKEDKEEKEDEEDEVSLSVHTADANVYPFTREGGFPPSEGSSRRTTNTLHRARQAVCVHCNGCAACDRADSVCCRSMVASLLSHAAVLQLNHKLLCTYSARSARSAWRRRKKKITARRGAMSVTMRRWVLCLQPQLRLLLLPPTTRLCNG